MSSKIERAKRLSSSKTTEILKNVKVQGFEQLIADLQAISMANQKSQDAITKSIEQLSKVILTVAADGPDVSAVVAAIEGLKEKLAVKANPPMDYVINFDRDKYGLMKTGIELNAKPKRLN